MPTYVGTYCHRSGTIYIRMYLLKMIHHIRTSISTHNMPRTELWMHTAGCLRIVTSDHQITDHVTAYMDGSDRVVMH